MNKQTNEQTDKRTNRWTDEHTNEQTYEQTNTVDGQPENILSSGDSIKMDKLVKRQKKFNFWLS